MRSTPRAATAALSLLAACFPGGTSTQVSGGTGGNGGTGLCLTCRRTSGGSGGAASSGGGASSSGGGTSGGGSTGSGGSTASAGGTNGAPQCETVSGAPPTPFDCGKIAPSFSGNAGGCDAGWFGTVVIDFGSCQPVCDLSMLLLGPDGLPLSGYSANTDPVTGIVHLCTTPDLVYTPSFPPQKGYVAAYEGEIQGGLNFDIGHFGLFSNTDISLISNFIPEGLNTSDAAAVFYVNGIQSCENQGWAYEGWSIGLELPDGESYPDGSYDIIYFDDAGYPSATLHAMSSFGTAIMANIDPTLGSFAIPVFTKADAGACPEENLAAGYTGRIYLSAGGVTEQPIVLP